MYCWKVFIVQFGPSVFLLERHRKRINDLFLCKLASCVTDACLWFALRGQAGTVRAMLLLRGRTGHFSCPGTGRAADPAAGPRLGELLHGGHYKEKPEKPQARPSGASSAESPRGGGGPRTTPNPGNSGSPRRALPIPRQAGSGVTPAGPAPATIPHPAPRRAGSAPGSAGTPQSRWPRRLEPGRARCLRDPPPPRQLRPSVRAAPRPGAGPGDAAPLRQRSPARIPAASPPIASSFWEADGVIPSPRGAAGGGAGTWNKGIKIEGEGGE